MADRLSELAQKHSDAAELLNKMKAAVRQSKAAYKLAEAEKALALEATAHIEGISAIRQRYLLVQARSLAPLLELYQEYMTALASKEQQEVLTQKLRDEYWDFKESMGRG